MNPLYLHNFLLHFIIHNVEKKTLSIINIEEVDINGFIITYWWLKHENGETVENIDKVIIDKDFKIIKLK